MLYPKELSKSRSSELISNSTSVDASKNTCFKRHPETVLPSESTELQRKRRSRERIWELAAFQGAEVGLRMLQFLAISRDKIATESRSRRDGGGGNEFRTEGTVFPAPLPPCLSPRVAPEADFTGKNNSTGLINWIFYSPAKERIVLRIQCYRRGC